MALQITKTSKHGIGLSYWKVVSQTADFHNRELVAELWGWADNNARQNLPKNPVDKTRVSWNENLGDSFPFSNSPDATELTSQVYQALLLLDEWSGAVEV